MNTRIFLSTIAFGVVLLNPINGIRQNSDSNKANKDLNFYLPTSTTSQIVKHRYYTLSYNEKAEQAEWVAYELKKDYIKRSDFKRPFFIEDPKVLTQ